MLSCCVAQLQAFALFTPYTIQVQQVCFVNGQFVSCQL